MTETRVKEILPESQEKKPSEKISDEFCSPVQISSAIFSLIFQILDELHERIKKLERRRDG